MANRFFKTPWCYEHSLVTVTGYFLTNGASSPTTLKGTGVASVARTGTGTYLLTLQDSFIEHRGMIVHLGLNASADSVAQLGAVSSTAKTVVIRTLTAGADADIAANANNKVFFTFQLKNSVVK